MTTAPHSAVAVEHLGVSLGGLPVLRDVSCTVNLGSITALLGGNGAGKSTLLKAILGIHPHQSGSITILDQPLNGFRQWARLGYVPQRSSLQLRQATVAEVVASGRLARRRPFIPPTAADRKHISQALDLVGLSDRRKDAFVDLSGGQQQRTLIARALAGEPELLLLDEPFAGVDLNTQARLADVLRTLHNGGKTILIVLHELGPLAHDIDHSIVLRNGRVIAAPPEEHHPAGHETDDPDNTTDLLTGLGEGRI